MRQNSNHKTGVSFKIDVNFISFRNNVLTLFICIHLGIINKIQVLRVYKKSETYFISGGKRCSEHIECKSIVSELKLYGEFQQP